MSGVSVYPVLQPRPVAVLQQPAVIVQLVTDVAPDPMPADEALEAGGAAAPARPFPGRDVGRRAAARGHGCGPIAKRAPEVLLCDETHRRARHARRAVAVLEVLKQINGRSGHHHRASSPTNAGIRAMAHRVINFADGKIAGRRE